MFMRDVFDLPEPFSFIYSFSSTEPEIRGSTKVNAKTQVSTAKFAIPQASVPKDRIARADITATVTPNKDNKEGRQHPRYRQLNHTANTSINVSISLTPVTTPNQTSTPKNAEQSTLPTSTLSFF